MGVRTDAIEDGSAGVIPVTYINSSAAIKAFVGEHGGIVCTSTNAAAIMTWAWERGEKLLMLPDQHLGRNTAFKMGVPLDRDGGLGSERDVGRPRRRSRCSTAKLILWKGHCSVHTRFTVAQIDAFRKKYPGRQGHRASGVHVRRRAGRRRERLDRVHHQHRQGTARQERSGRSRPRSTWSTGSTNEVAPDKTVVTLDPFGCLCSTMFRVSPNHLLWILEGLVEGQIHNQIIVPEPTDRTPAGARSDARRS